MTPSTDNEGRRQVAEEAAFWLLTVQSDEVTASQRAEFVDWLRASPLHIAEMLRVCRLQRELAAFNDWEQLASLPRVLPADVVQLQPVGAARTAPPSNRRARSAALLAAGVAALCATALLVFGPLGQERFRTQLGEHREVTLADASVVELGPDSDVRVRYRPGERLLTLEHGEALFRVAKNPDRPFIVQAGQTRVRAVGTVFNVGRGEQGVSVTVVEGRVAVSQQPAERFARFTSRAPTPVASLQANERISINRDGVASDVRKVDEPDDGSAGAGADQLVFDNETVGEVARRFNLRNSTKIDIQDATLAARRISGVFRGSDPQSFVSFIEAAADIRVTQQDYKHIVLGSPNGDNREATP